MAEFTRPDIQQNTNADNRVSRRRFLQLAGIASLGTLLGLFTYDQSPVTAAPTLTPPTPTTSSDTLPNKLYFPNIETKESVYTPNSLKSIAVSFGGNDGDSVGLMRINPDGTFGSLEKIKIADRAHVVEPQIVISPDRTRRYATWGEVVPGQSQYGTFMVVETHTPNGPIEDVEQQRKIRLTPDNVQYYETHILERPDKTVLAVSAGRNNTLAITTVDTNKTTNVTATKIVQIVSGLPQYGIRTPFPVTSQNGDTYAYFVADGKLQRLRLFDASNNAVENATQEPITISALSGFRVTQAHGTDDGHISVAGIDAEGNRKLLLIQTPPNLNKENTSPMAMEGMVIEGISPSVQQFGSFKTPEGIVITVSHQPPGERRSVKAVQVSQQNNVHISDMSIDAGDAFPSTLSQPEVASLFRIAANAKHIVY